MQIIYAKPIHEKITEARLAARKDNKEIEKIVLNRREWERLRQEMQQYSRPGRFFVQTPSVQMYDGIEIEVDMGAEF